MVATGEAEIAVLLYLYMVEEDIKKGAPMGWAASKPATATQTILAGLKNAPHPNAAKLWMEYLYSDEGQLIWLSPPGYCHPIRQDAMLAAGKIPADLLAKLPSTEGAVFPSNADLIAGKEIVVTGWDSAVGADIKAGQ